MLPIDYSLFLQFAFFLTITPGTPRVVIVTYAINYGLKRSAITAIGDVLIHN
jgi:threonine/homoserine/homoserine lactone efflux protein